MIYVIATHEAKPDREDDLRDALVDLIGASRAEDGCRRYDLHEDLERSGYFVFYEIWEDQASFDRHKSSQHLACHARRAPELTAFTDVRMLKQLS